MSWTTKRSLWACIRPNGDLLCFYPGTPQLWTKKRTANEMIRNPKHKVIRVVKVKVTFEEIE
jgi:hypothetical protein